MNRKDLITQIDKELTVTYKILIKNIPINLFIFFIKFLLIGEFSIA
jgi:hypothetical protein